jgi:hypothetical protein
MSDIRNFFGGAKGALFEKSNNESNSNNKSKKRVIVDDEDNDKPENISVKNEVYLPKRANVTNA